MPPYGYAVLFFGPFRYLPKSFGQIDVLHLFRLFEQRRNFIHRKSRYSATDLGNQKSLGRMPLSELDKLVHIGLNRFHASLHGRNGITLSLQACALSPDRTEFPVCQIGGSSRMMALRITAEDEHLVRFEFRDSIR